jgi:transcriptional regulator with XRE-family HTH domain
LGAHFHNQRLAKGQTQKEAAAVLGITPSTYSQWEDTQRSPCPRHWPAILSYLGYDPICTSPVTVPEMIAFLQRHLGLTLSALARLVGAHRQTLANAGERPEGLKKGVAAKIDALVIRTGSRRD